MHLRVEQTTSDIEATIGAERMRPFQQNALDDGNGRSVRLTQDRATQDRVTQG